MHRTVTRLEPRSGRPVTVARQSVAVPRSIAPSLDQTMIMPRIPLDGITAATAAAVPSVALLRAAAPAVERECGGRAAWQRVQDAGDLRLIVRGRGSLPYSEIEVTQQGRAIGTIRARWQRLPRSWILVSQEFTSADGSLRDAVQVRHYDERGPASAFVDPDGPCLGGGAPAPEPPRGATPPFGTSASTRSTAAPFSPRASLPEMQGEGVCDTSDGALEAGPCASEYYGMIAASAALAGATALMSTACLSTEVVSKAECVSAISAMVSASMALTLATNKLKECKEKARATSLACGCAPSLRAEASGEELRADIATGYFSTGSALSCSGWDGWSPDMIPSPGGGRDQSDTTYVLVVCTLEDFYDGDGRYLYTINRGCTYTLATM